MKVVIFGCQQIAVDFIDFLLTECHQEVDVPLVLTYELPMDKTYGYKSVFEEAKKKGLDVRNVGRVSDTLIKEIQDIKPDVIFSVYYRKIFPQALLDIPKLGCINIHPSLLPFYRGPVPTSWAISNGETETGITIHYMDAKIDTGDILIQKKYPIEHDETGFELYTKCMKLGAQLLKENFYKIIHQKIRPYKQEGAGSYYGKRGWKCIIDWQRKAEDIRNIIRVHARPYNSAEAILLNRYLLIDKATMVENKKYLLQGPGQIVDILKNNRLVVSCADGFLRLDKYEIFPKLNKTEEEVYFKVGNKFD